jgi:ABC-type lipoprotein release transport system permease subunit
MLIVEKEKDIKTLKILGMSKQNLKSLFFKHNLLINLIGGFIGFSLSVIIVYLQDYYSFFKIPGLDTAYPVALQTSNIVLVFVTLILVGLFSGIISSLVVKKLNN